MKNQYVGDINDYRKYGLLRAIQSVTDFRLLVAWMLTPDDASNDGNLTAYLDESTKWSHFDPALFDTLRNVFSSNVARNVDLIEQAGLIDRASFYADIVPDAQGLRADWLNALLEAAAGADLVFLDPDNGLEIPSKKRGAKHSSKFLYFEEVAALWNRGKSLLIYQHFPRVKRSVYLAQRTEELHRHAAGAHVEVFFTPHVAFFLLLQSAHGAALGPVRKIVGERWSHQLALGMEKQAT